MELIKGKHYFLKGQHLNIMCVSLEFRILKGTLCKPSTIMRVEKEAIGIKGQYPKIFPGAGSAVVVLVQPLDKEGILGPSYLTLRKQIHPLNIL